jgi:hypothetical protein
MDRHAFEAWGLGIALMFALAACGDVGNSLPIGTATAIPPTPGSLQGMMSRSGLKERMVSSENSKASPGLDRSKDIAGPDANANGVRDDIESWINAQPVNDRQRKSLVQDARATQRTLLVDLKDQAALQKTSDGLAASLNCGGENFPDYVVFSRLAGKIESMTANTKERAARYMQYNAARSGSSTTMPSGDTCEP